MRLKARSRSACLGSHQLPGCWESVHVLGSKIKRLKLILCITSTVLVRKKLRGRVQAMQQEWCDFGDSTCEFNKLIFSFETGIAHVKMNGKFCANFNILIFLCLR